MNTEVLIRYSVPTKYDQYPVGTQCKVIQTLSADYELYEQICPNQENPIWMYRDRYKKSFDDPSR